MRLACAYHQDGRLSEAEANCRAALEALPEHPDALHLLGLIAFQRGDQASAAEFLERAIRSAPQRADFLSNAGAVYGALRRAADAERCYRAALAVQPDLAPAHRGLGDALVAAGRLQEAERSFRSAVALDPRFAIAHNDLGNVLQELGRHAEAAQCYRVALQLEPDLPEIHNNLGNALRALGEPLEAEGALRKALALRPDYPEAHCNLGAVLEELGRFEQAEASLRRALALMPRSAQAHNNLGNVLQAVGRRAEAERCYVEALALDPAFADAHANLGMAWKALGRFEDASRSFAQALALDPRSPSAHLGLAEVLRALGRPAEAEESCRRALALAPDDPLALSILGSVIFDLGRLADAERCAREALAIRPSSAAAHYLLGEVQRRRGDLEDAAESYRGALALNAQFAEAHINLGEALKNLGRLEEAERCYRAALDVDPDNAVAHSGLLFALNYFPGRGPADIFAQYEAFGRRFAGLNNGETHPNAPDPERKLRVGYVSGDFRAHSVAFFIEPVLAMHDRERFEIFCYYAFAGADALTEHLKGHADHWRDVSTMSDDALADLVRADRIDILVDLSGHSAANRLLAFARKPAPVQATWFGNLNTTGLRAVDWRISDAHASPIGRSEAFHSERLMRLPASLYCYRPPDDCPEVAPTPLERSGAPTFGAFTNSIKIAAPVIELWGRLIERMPGSRLLVLCSNLARLPADGRERYVRLGIAGERLELMASVPFREYLARHAAVDVMLDTFPCAGATTTCHALWMGVPVVTLSGDTETSRLGASLLNAIGLDALVARTPEQYVDIAARLALDPKRLASLRAGMRERMRASPLMDAAGFTLDLESAYRSMWKDWCEAQRQ
jgi:predicted O-linked N-acetylglucosamine transferase (SPINDLY family)